jgi:exodeoxyribonuclease V alpha subunit
MAKANVEITATLLFERRPPNCENFFIAECRVVGGEYDGKTIKFVGNCEEGELQPQLTYRFYGYWKDDPKWGLQFNVVTFVMAMPHGRQGIVKYLEINCDEIGKARAEQLWNKFNADAVRVCREHPEILADSIKGLSLEQAQHISDQLKAAESVESVSIELIDFFAGMNVPKSVYKEALRLWGNKATELFKINPYLMLALNGIGFLKADNIYCQLGLPLGRTKRQIHCLNYEAKQVEDTWVSDGQATQLLQKKIAGTGVNLERALAVGTRAKMFTTKRHCGKCGGSGRGMIPDLFDGETLVDGPCIACRGSGGPRWIALAQRAANEQIVAEKASILLRTTSQWPDVGLVKGVSDHQRAALANSFKASLACFIGGPGTGKSHTTAALVRTLLQKFGAGSVAAAAPTNKAAVRLTQGFRANDIGLNATSIHSLLGVEKVEDGNWEFRHSRRNPFPYRAIILDETSMLSTDLAACVFDAIMPGTMVLMIGDTGQLPPIQHGAVLRDFLAAGVPVGELTEPQRNAGDLVFACQDIKQGRRFRESAEIDLDSLPPRNFKFIHASNPDEQIEELHKLLDWAKSIGLDPVWDCQVMSAVNKTSKVSREVLNKILQERFNPGDQANFRVKDKVICDENGFYKTAAAPSNPPTDFGGDQGGGGDEDECFIAKGEFGQVLGINKKFVVVKFDEGRIVSFPLGRERKSSVPADGGTTESSCPIQLAYSCTVHRMQGSECKLAIPMIDESAGAKWLGCRELFFTAISRGKLLTRPIGQRSTADAMCKKVSIGKRKTFLAELVKQYLGSQPKAAVITEQMAMEAVDSAFNQGSELSTDLAAAGVVG